jgi:hypothetical protein
MQIKDFSKNAVPDSEFSVLYGDDAIYFALIAFEPEMAELVANINSRKDDLKVYQDDCFELMLSPGNRERHFQFIFNANGVYGDRKLIQGGSQSLQVDKKLNMAAKKLTDRWVVEIAIPFSELDLSEGVGDMWYFNLVRDRRVLGKGQPSVLQPSIYFPTAAIHNTGNLGVLAGVEIDFSRFKVGVDGIRICKVTPGEDGRLDCLAELSVRNDSGKLMRYELTAEAKSPKGDTLCRSTKRNAVDDGEAFWLPLELPGLVAGENRLDLILKDVRSGKTISHSILPLQLKYEPFSVRVAKPAHRSAIYATMNIKEVVLKIDSSLPPESWRGKKLSLSIADAKGKTVAAQEVANLADIAEGFSIQVPRMEAGTYVCKAQLQNQGKPVHESETTLFVFPPAETEIRIDDFQRLIVNGKPVFPIGACAVDIDQALALGLDHALQFGVLGTNSAITTMDKYWQRKIRLMPHVWSASTQSKVSGAKAYGSPLATEEKREISAVVKKQSAHPGLLMYFMEDELTLGPVLPERIANVYDIIKNNDPYHPAFFTITHPSDEVAAYAESCDLIVADLYPGFAEGGGFITGGPRYISSGLETLRRVTGGSKMLMLMPQAFDWSEFGSGGQRGPTFLEERCMVYLGIIHGARGINFYSAPGFYNTPEFIVGIPALVKEMRALEPALLAKEEIPVEIKSDKRESIHALARRHANGAVTIFACNVEEDREIHAGLHLPIADGEFIVASESRKVSIASGIINDVFPPCGVHIYTNDANAKLGELKTLSALAGDVTAEDRRREDRRNLAFFRNLKNIRDRAGASTPAQLRLPFDGYEKGRSWSAAVAEKQQKEISENWIEAEFAKPVTLAKITLALSSVPSYRIELLTGGKWLTVVEQASQKGGDRQEHSFAPVAGCAKIRFVATGDSLKAGRLYELSAYAEN